MTALMWRLNPHTLTMAVCAGREPGTAVRGGYSRSDRGDDRQKQGTEIPPLHSVCKLPSLWRLGALPSDVGRHQVRLYHDAWGGMSQHQQCKGEPPMRLQESLSGTNT
jgi:hypothetical protein